MKNYWLGVSAVYGFLAVAFGAFGAHGLKAILTPDMLTVFETGARYQLIHSVLMVGLSFAQVQNSKFLFSLKSILVGVTIFSGSLYLYTLTGIKFFAIITPLGGLGMLIGWASIAVVGFNGGAPD